MQPQQHGRHFLDFQETLMLPNEAFSENFFRAFGWGTLAGGLPFMVFTVPIGIAAIFSTGPFALLIAILPLIISMLGTTTLMIAVELPLTALLRWFEYEKAAVYAPISMAAGTAIPFVFAWAVGWNPAGAIFFALFGAIAGLTAGTVWGTWRQSLFAPPGEARRSADAHPAPPIPTL